MLSWADAPAEEKRNEKKKFKNQLQNVKREAWIIYHREPKRKKTVGLILLWGLNQAHCGRVAHAPPPKSVARFGVKHLSWTHGKCWDGIKLCVYECMSKPYFTLAVQYAPPSLAQIVKRSTSNEKLFKNRNIDDTITHNITQLKKKRIGKKGKITIIFLILTHFLNHTYMLSSSPAFVDVKALPFLWLISSHPHTSHAY